jgi:hypothetical protein
MAQTSKFRSLNPSIGWLIRLISGNCFFKHQPSTCHVCWSNVYVKSINHVQSILVGGFNPSEKYESQLGSLFPIYGKIKAMFHTTNQIMFSQSVVLLLTRCDFRCSQLQTSSSLAPLPLSQLAAPANHPMRFPEPGECSWKKRGCPQLCWCGFVQKSATPRNALKHLPVKHGP